MKKLSRWRQLLKYLPAPTALKSQRYISTGEKSSPVPAVAALMARDGCTCSTPTVGGASRRLAATVPLRSDLYNRLAKEQQVRRVCTQSARCAPTRLEALALCRWTLTCPYCCSALFVFACSLHFGFRSYLPLRSETWPRQQRNTYSSPQALSLARCLRLCRLHN